MSPSFLAGLAGSQEEEQGKKDDDHKNGGSSQWMVALKTLLRVRRRRLILFTLAIVMIWFLFTHRLQDMIYKHREHQEEFIQASPHGGDFEVVGDSNPWGFGHTNHFDSSQGSWDDGSTEKNAPTPQPYKGKKPDRFRDATNYYYEGAIKFYALPSTINAASRMGGYRNKNQNVLFAAASLRSVSALIPSACAMAKQANNHVHMVFMGRNELPVDEVLRVNGVDKRSCQIFFHDARPDFASYSSDLRAESSVANALKYIHQFLHPQVIITDTSLTEEMFFTRTIRSKAKEYSIPLIQITGPLEKIDHRPLDNLAWISRLDTSSLAAWHQPNIEIVIQAPTGSSGPLIRLLQSLAKADYSGTTPPKITIEMPSETDKILGIFLNEFQWPPNGSPLEKSGVNLRRRIPIRSLTPEEAAVRFMESFYPSHPDHSHVLILSPNAQITPLYYQALRYYLLTYKYSTSPSTFPPVLGIALDLPTVVLNGSEKFKAPTLSDLDTADEDDFKPISNTVRPPFLWEAPNANAALYLGRSWVELHSFLSLRLAKFHSEKNPQPREKLVGSHMPAWSEYVLEFMRARGYSFFYPGSISPMEAFASVRAEADPTPDEFYNTLSKRDSSLEQGLESPSPSVEDEPSGASKRSASEPTVFIEPFLPPDHKPNSLPTKSSPLHSSAHAPQTFQHLNNLLPFRRPEPSLLQIPHYAFDGADVPFTNIAKRALSEAESFRKEIGGCTNVLTPAGKRRVIRQGSAADLFCFGDESWEDLPTPRRDDAGRAAGLRTVKAAFGDAYENVPTSEGLGPRLPDEAGTSL
jgi:hypothetical protein